MVPGADLTDYPDTINRKDMHANRAGNEKKNIKLNQIMIKEIHR